MVHGRRAPPANEQRRSRSGDCLAWHRTRRLRSTASDRRLRGDDVGPGRADGPCARRVRLAHLHPSGAVAMRQRGAGVRAAAVAVRPLGTPWSEHRHLRLPAWRAGRLQRANDGCRQGRRLYMRRGVVRRSAPHAVRRVPVNPAQCRHRPRAVPQHRQRRRASREQIPGMAPRGRVLVLDGARVHALDIVRSLGRRGLSVYVGANVHDAISFSSRFASAARVYPDPAAEPDAFIAWLLAEIRGTGYDLVIPVTDVTAIPISRNLSELSALCPLATEAVDKIQLVSDKSRTLEIARRLDVPCPTTVVVRHADEIAHGVAHLRFPVVCKPLASGTWGRSGYVALPVSYALDEHELRREVTQRLATSPVLLQEYRRGVGVGIEVLAHNGTIVQAFQHERLHELPLSGGASTYRVSVPLDPVLLDYSARLIEDLRWTGVAMVEFKVDRATSDAALMEINGRFWGSLALSTRAGMAFASDLYDLLTTGHTGPSRSYRTGVRCRKLRDDIEWLKDSLTLDAQHPLVVAGLMRRRSRAELIAAALRMFWPWQQYDVQVLWDPRPGIIDLRDILIAHAKGAARKIAQVVRKARAWWYRLRNSGKLARRASSARSVLFVCYGNIMRSPFASEYLASRS